MRRPRSAAQHAAYFVEHVLATDADNYLATAEQQYAWWQLALLDVYLVLFAGVTAILGFVGIILWLIARYIKSMLQGGRAKQKAN